MSTELNFKSIFKFTPWSDGQMRRKISMFSYPCICFCKFYYHIMTKLPNNQELLIYSLMSCKSRCKPHGQSNSTKYLLTQYILKTSVHNIQNTNHVQIDVLTDPGTFLRNHWVKATRWAGMFPFFFPFTFFYASFSGSTPCSDTRHQQVLGLLHAFFFSCLTLARLSLPSVTGNQLKFIGGVKQVDVEYL